MPAEVDSMRKDLGAKPFLYPMPVLMIATYDADGVPNVMNAAWGCISDERKVSITVDRSHKTMANILARKAFTVSPATASHVAACDYLGIVSGNDVPDKVARSGLHVTGSGKVDAPVIDELPLALECRMVSYDDATEVLVGEIVGVSADEGILSADGRIDVSKLDPITYDTVNKKYLRLGDIVGSAFSDGKSLR